MGLGGIGDQESDQFNRLMGSDGKGKKDRGGKGWSQGIGPAKALVGLESARESTHGFSDLGMGLGRS